MHSIVSLALSLPLYFMPAAGIVAGVYTLCRAVLHSIT